MRERIQFKNGRLKVMQISDLQDTKMTTVDTLRFLDSVLAEQKPDLIILSGDQLDVVGLWGKGERCKRNVRRAINGLFNIIEKHNIPYALTFGNHDAETGVSVAEQAKIYSELPNCICFDCLDDGRPDVGTFNIPIYSSDGESVALNFYLMDTHGSKADNKIKGLNEKQLEWYRQMSENIGRVPSMVFQHLPPDEVYELLKEVKRGTTASHPAFETRKGKYYAVDRTKTDSFEAFGETPSATPPSNAEFELMREQGDVFAIAFGHDHYNSFAGNVRGIDLIYCPGAGYNTYGLKNRAVRIYEFDESNVRKYKTRIVKYSDCCRKSETAPIKNYIYCHAPSSKNVAAQFAFKALGIILAIIMVLVFLNTINEMFIKSFLFSVVCGGAFYGTISTVYNAILRKKYTGGKRNGKRTNTLD